MGDPQTTSNGWLVILDHGRPHAIDWLGVNSAPVC